MSVLKFILGGVKVFQYVTSGSFAPTTTSFAIPASAFVGCQAGDMFLIGGGSVGHGMTLTSTGYTTTGTIEYTANVSAFFMWRTLTAGDISGGITINGTANGYYIDWAVYRNVASVALASQSADDNTSPGNTVCVIPGFTKSAHCAGIVAYSVSRDSAPSRTAPSGFTMRIQNQSSAANGAGAGLADMMNAANYTNGSTLTFTNESSSLDGRRGFAFELRTA